MKFQHSQHDSPFPPSCFNSFQLIPWHHKLPSDLTIPKLRENITFPMALLIGSPLVMWYLTLFILKTFVEFWKFMRIWMSCRIRKLLFRCLGMDWLLMKMTLVGQTIQTKRPEPSESPKWKWLANKKKKYICMYIYIYPKFSLTLSLSKKKLLFVGFNSHPGIGSLHPISRRTLATFSKEAPPGFALRKKPRIRSAVFGVSFWGVFLN